MWTWLRRLGLVLIVPCGLAIAVGVRTLELTSSQPTPLALDKSVTAAIDDGAAATRLAHAVQFATVTYDDRALAASTAQAFDDFHQFLANTFPRTHQRLTREAFGHSLLFTWIGRDAALPPVILAAHQDVVPASPDGWTFPPFSGAISAGAIWGRGTLDDKVGVMGVLEAIEALVASGFQPARTIYLAFGHDEEAGTEDDGATTMAAALAARGVHDAVVLDEGGWIYDKVPGLTRHVALIGVSEKGFLSLRLSVASPGGHSSMPPQETAIGILAAAVSSVEQHPMPPRLDGASAALFAVLAPEMSWPLKPIFANRWLTQPLVLRRLAQQPATDATIRTTTAATMFSAGDKDNVLATSATAVINFRLLPGDSITDVVTHVRAAVNDPRVTIAPLDGRPGIDASPVSSSTSPAFGRIAGAVRGAFPDVLTAPYLVLGATDGRRYQAVASNIYRFVPVDQPGATELLHAPNEHIQVAVYGAAIRAYVGIIDALTR